MMDATTTTAADPRLLMDRMYRLQRHIYDPTRAYYLLGRDRTLANMRLQPGDRVLEVGCGTGRNLERLSRMYPGVTLVGIDASAAMLETAGARLVRTGLERQVRLMHSLAEELVAAEPYDAVLFSYALSMIPAWRPAVDRAVAHLRPGGAIHVVDFWDQGGLPAWFAALLRGWLGLFGVVHRPSVLRHFRSLEDAGEGRLSVESIARRYAYRLEFVRR